MSRESCDGVDLNLTRGEQRNDQRGDQCSDQRGDQRGDQDPAIVSKITYKGIRADVLEDVYEPAEDTFLLADCAVDAVSLLFPPEFSKSGVFFVRGLEIGCGSGFVSQFIQSKAPPVHMVGVDINPNAVLCSRRNGVRAYYSDMFDIFERNQSVPSSASSLPDDSSLPPVPPLPDDLPALPAEGFDFILFNPPYLPTAADERVAGYLNYAFDGGIFGRDSIDRFLGEVGDYLSDAGFFLLLISSLTGLPEVTDEMRKNGFSAEVLGRTKVSFEELFVLKGKRL